ncbi:MAG: hypothetical protein FWG91_02615 [Lachnospiraceae bacterium]|nr:hypothetical protein [Lachnospiraceae bacterium]
MISQEKSWQQFANEVQATYDKRSFFGSDKIEAAFQNWKIIYDMGCIPVGCVLIPYTRIRTPFLTKANFKFSISKKNIFNKIAEKLGKSIIEIGEPHIDDNFMVKSNSAKKISQMLSNEKIADLALRIHEKSYSDFELSCGYKSSLGYNFPKNSKGLCLVIPFEVKDKERLMLYYDFFKEVLTYLFEAGEIEDTVFDVNLKTWLN